MNKSLPLIAFATSLCFAAPVKIGFEGLIGYNVLSLGEDLGAGLVTGSPQAKPSFGLAIGPTLTVPVNVLFGVEGGVSFLYDRNSFENTIDAGILGSNLEEHTIDQVSVGLKIQPVFQIAERFQVKAGYEWDMPIGGTAETKRTTTLLGLSTISTRTADIVWAPSKLSDVKTSDAAVLSTHNLIAGASYDILPNLAVTLQGKFALTGSQPSYKANGDLDGAASSSSNMMSHQIALGLKLGML